MAGTLREGGRAYYYARAFSREVLNPHPWCREVEASFRARHRLVPAFELQLPVDEDESARDRRIARWQPINVFEVLAPE